VTARDPDDDGDLAGRHGSDPVPDHRAGDRVLPSRGAFEVRERSQRGRPIDLVVERDDTAGLGPVRAHPSGEDHHSAEARSLEFAGGGGQRQSSARQSNRHR
jgi:hypothetical protein